MPLTKMNSVTHTLILNLNTVAKDDSGSECPFTCLQVNMEKEETRVQKESVEGIVQKQ